MTEAQFLTALKVKVEKGLDTAALTKLIEDRLAEVTKVKFYVVKTATGYLKLTDEPTEGDPNFITTASLADASRFATPGDATLWTDGTDDETVEEV